IANHDSDAPLSFAQQRLWFLQHLDPETSAYNCSSAVSLRGALDIPCLERALEEIVRRHASLRTCFPDVEGRPRQEIGNVDRFVLMHSGLPGEPVSQRWESARRLAEQAARQTFDLARGPLFKVHLYRLSAEHQLMLLSMHHIVGDA